MKKAMVVLAAALAAVAGFGGAAGDRARDNGKEKMCLAHLMACGFDHTGHYDDWANTPWNIDPYPDRSALGRWVQCDSGLGGGGRKIMMRMAKEHGIDGFAVDVLTGSYVEIMREVCRSAEGMDFKCVLCVDNNCRFKPDFMLNAMTKYAKELKHHPNSWRKDGKLVVFIYNAGMEPAEWKALQAKMNESEETSIYTYGQFEEKWADAVDAGYHFGGSSPEQIEAAVDAYRKRGKPYCAGNSFGYLGRRNGCYLPYNGTKGLREQWETAIRLKAEHMCLGTWNDYEESHHFEPSEQNGAGLLRINREYLRKWRGEKPDGQGFADAVISYQEEMLEGMEFEFEVFTLPYGIGETALWLRTLGEDGKELKAFGAMALPKGDSEVKRLRMTEADLKGNRVVRVQAAGMEAGKAPGEEDWRELPHVTRRTSHMATPRWRRVSLSEIGKKEKCRLTLEARKTKASVGLFSRGYLTAGKLELLRDGWPVWRDGDFNIRGKMFRSVLVDLPEPVAPREVFSMRFTNLADEKTYSEPLVRDNGKVRMVERDVPVSRTTHDEERTSWDKTIDRSFTVERRSVPEHATFAVDFDFRKAEPKPAGELKDREYFYSSGAWKLPALVTGGKWVEDKDLKARALEFGEKTAVTYRTRTFPSWTYRLGCVVKPEATGRTAVVFCEYLDCGIKIDRDGRAIFYNRGRTLKSKTALKFGKWSRIDAGFDGKEIVLWVNGKEEDRGPVMEQRRKRIMINSRPQIGASFWETDKTRFRGRMARFYLRDGFGEPAAGAR